MPIFPFISIIAWLVIGATCGWLETERLAGKGFGLYPNIVVGIIGSFLAGWFFLVWGELVPNNPYLAPMVSGLVGAGISLSLWSTVANVFRSS